MFKAVELERRQRELLLFDLGFEKRVEAKGDQVICGEFCWRRKIVKLWLFGSTFIEDILHLYTFALRVRPRV